MRDTQRQLYDLGVFARVDTAIQNPDGDTADKYVLYDMEEARKYSIAMGFGAEFARIGGCSTCLEAPQGETGFAPDATLDVSRLNLWGLGHSLSFRGRVSTLEQRALINYTAPRVRRQRQADAVVHHPLRQQQGRAHLHRAARGRLRAAFRAALEGDHVFVPLHVPARHGGSIHVENLASA